MSDIADGLYTRWWAYHQEFMRGGSSREAVAVAYDDWTSAVDSGRQDAFDARQGGALLRSIGVKTYKTDKESR